MGWVVVAVFFAFLRADGDDGGVGGDDLGGGAVDCGVVFLGFMGVGDGRVDGGLVAVVFFFLLEEGGEGGGIGDELGGGAVDCIVVLGSVGVGDGGGVGL